MSSIFNIHEQCTETVEMKNKNTVNGTVHETLQRVIKSNNIGDNLRNFCGNSSALVRLYVATLVTFANTITSASASVVGPVTFDH